MNKTICMVIGDPVEHSLSPQIHNAGYEALHLNFTFVAKRVTPDELSQFIDEVREKNIRGVSVTLPHKTAVMDYLDERDDAVQQIGAVNTIVNTNGVLKGYNTDWVGIVGPIGQRTTIEGKTVAIIGARGAARAAAYGITQKGGTIEIYNRTPEKAEELAREFGGKAFSLDELEQIKNADIIINTTPVGMQPHENETPLPKEYISNKQIIMDVVYTPRETRLLQEAKEKGAAIIHGTEMFLEQAYPQFKLYTGHDAPIAIMKGALM